MASALYGRDVPLQELRAALDTALVGKGHLAVVSGEAGIGKSAIVAEIAREAEARRAIVTWGRAWEFADAPPYFPVWPCLRSLGVVIDRLAPPGAPVESAVGQDAFRLWEDVVRSLARASSTSPVVWVLEDLHAADLLTLDLLTFLAQPLRAMRAMVIVTARDQDPRLTDRAAQRLTRMARDGVDVRLTPLREHDVAALASAVTGREIGGDLVHRLTELTGGNPLFVVECGRAIRTPRGQLGSLPPTVRKVVLDRLAMLPDATRDALASGAVLGREFSAASVARMHGLLPAQVIEALLHALRSGLVAEARPGQFAFSHALVRDAVYAELDPMKRAEVHRCAARALAAEEVDTGELLVERARHALAGLPGGEVTEILALADRASTLLERGGAFDRAFELHLRVQEARRGGLLPAASGEENLRFASISRTAGRLDVTSRLCEAILASARTAPPRRSAPCSWGATSACREHTRRAAVRVGRRESAPRQPSPTAEPVGSPGLIDEAYARYGVRANQRAIANREQRPPETSRLRAKRLVADGLAEQLAIEREAEQVLRADRLGAEALVPGGDERAPRVAFPISGLVELLGRRGSRAHPRARAHRQ